MDVHFVHDQSCITCVKFCLFGAFTYIIVVLQVTVLFKDHVSRFFDIAVLCFYRLFFLRERFQIISMPGDAKRRQKVETKREIMPILPETVSTKLLCQ